MTKSWRPEGWDEIKRGILPLRLESLDPVPFRLIEAGADAMLEALKKKGHYVDVSKYRGAYGIVINDLYPLEKIPNDFKGWYVSVPDDK